MKSATILCVLVLMLFSGNVFAKDPEPQAPTRDEQLQYSGFLDNYDDFKILNPETNAEVWIKPPHQDLSLLKDYTAIIFSPIEIWMHSASDYQGIDPNELKLITDYFLEQLENNLSKKFEIVDKAGPNVMNLRIAITGVRKVKPHKEVYDFIPVKLVWDASNSVYRKATGKHLDVYEAQVEMEIRDAKSRERLVAAIDKHGVEETTEEGEHTWEPLEEVIDYWARIISSRLSQARSS